MTKPKAIPIFDEATQRLIAENNKLKQDNGELQSRCVYYVDMEFRLAAEIRKLRKQVKNLKAQNAVLKQHLNPTETD
jgi:cell division septum initiation protein DivIVA